MPSQVHRDLDWSCDHCGEGGFHSPQELQEHENVYCPNRSSRQQIGGHQLSPEQQQVQGQHGGHVNSGLTPIMPSPLAADVPDVLGGKGIGTNRMQQHQYNQHQPLHPSQPQPEHGQQQHFATTTSQLHQPVLHHYQQQRRFLLMDAHYDYTQYGLSMFDVTSCQNVEIFEALPQHVKADPATQSQLSLATSSAEVEGQVGIRCIHCINTDPSKKRDSTAYIFPRDVKNIGISVQLISYRHISRCKMAPNHVRDTLRQQPPPTTDIHEKLQQGNDVVLQPTQQLLIDYCLSFCQRMAIINRSLATSSRATTTSTSCGIMFRDNTKLSNSIGISAATNDQQQQPSPVAANVERTSAKNLAAPPTSSTTMPAPEDNPIAPTPLAPRRNKQTEGNNVTSDQLQPLQPSPPHQGMTPLNPGDSGGFGDDQTPLPILQPQGHPYHAPYPHDVAYGVPMGVSQDYAHQEQQMQQQSYNFSQPYQDASSQNQHQYPAGYGMQAYSTHQGGHAQPMPLQVYPFFQDHTGAWTCRYCSHVNSQYRDPHSVWSTPSHTPPSGHYIEQHLSMCRYYHQQVGVMHQQSQHSNAGMPQYNYQHQQIEELPQDSHHQVPMHPPADWGHQSAPPNFYPQSHMQPHYNAQPGWGAPGHEQLTVQPNLLQQGGENVIPTSQPTPTSTQKQQQHRVEGGEDNNGTLFYAQQPSQPHESDPIPYYPDKHNHSSSAMSPLNSQHSVQSSQNDSSYATDCESRGTPRPASRTRRSPPKVASKSPPQYSPARIAENDPSVLAALDHLIKVDSDKQKKADQMTVQLVLNEDKLLLTDYLFYLMKQLQVCRFTEKDRKTRGGKRENIKLGYGGLQCMHCIDAPNCRKFFWSNVDRLANSFAEIPSHVLKCRHCPEPTKNALAKLKERHPVQMSKLPRGSQKVFFRRMWRRLHDNDPQSGVGGMSSPMNVPGLDSRGSFGTHCSAGSMGDLPPIHKSAPSRDESDMASQSSIATSTEDSLFPPRSTEDAAKILAASALSPVPLSPSSRVLLAIPEDKQWLSDMDCFVRKQLEVFCAIQEDLSIAQSDRKYPIQLGQLGIRCVHCALSNDTNALRGHAVAYPYSISSIYEAVREFQRLHLDSCPYLPASARGKLLTLKGSTSLSSVLRKYYVVAAKALGMYDTNDGIRSGGDAIQVVPAAQFAFSESASVGIVSDEMPPLAAARESTGSLIGEIGVTASSDTGGTTLSGGSASLLDGVSGGPNFTPLDSRKRKSLPMITKQPTPSSVDSAISSRTSESSPKKQQKFRDEEEKVE